MTQYIHRVGDYHYFRFPGAPLELLASCRDGCTEVIMLASFTIADMVELPCAGVRQTCRSA